MATLTRPRTRQRSYLHRLWTRELRAPTHEPCTEQDTSASPDSASRITNANDPDRQAPNLNDATSGRLRRYLGGNIPGRRRLQSTQGRSANDFDLAPQNAERTGALRETSPSRYSLEGPRLSNGVPLNPDPAPTPDPTIPPAPVPIQQQEEALGEPSPDRSSLPGPGPSNGAVLNPDSAPTAEPTILPVPNLIQPQEEANLPPTGMQASNPRETISSLPTDTSNPAESRMNHDTEAILVSGGRVGHKERLTAPREVSAAFIASMDTYCVRVSNARRSSGVYWLHWRTYVGKLKENPPPVCMDEEWCTLREILVQDLGPVIESLFSSLGDTKAACIEPELCMTGKLRYYLNTVDLRPTIWIRCGSEMCQKKVEEATQDLDYLKPFRKKGRVQVQLKAPRLSARFQSVSGAISGPSATVPFGFHVSVLIPDTVSYHVPSACGMRIKCRSVDGLATEQVWIVGGLIRIDSTIYGLTAAHPIFDGITHEAEPHGARLMSEDTRTQSEGSTQTPTRPHESEEGNWHTATVHSVNYGGRISLPGVTPQTMHANCSDYALVRLDARAEVLPNSYESPENSQEGACIVDSISSDPACGEVLILCSPGDVRSGYLLGLPALFMTHMGVFHTRKIQTEAPFELGISGTWVVRGSSLLGIVIAVYEDEPYLHMLPIQQILSDIQSQQLKNGQVATIDLKRRGNPATQLHQVHAVGSVEEQHSENDSVSISRQYIPPRVEGNSTVSSTNVRQTERTANRPIPTFPLAEVEAATRKTERRTTLHRIANFSPVFSHHLRLLAILISIGIFSLCLGLESTMFPVVAPKISNEFGSLRYIGWYGSANLLASSVMEPIFSYVLTVSSRSARWLDVLRMIFLLTGWLTSGFSHSPTVMIVGRIISGFGVAGAPCGTLRASNPLLKSMASRKLTSRSSFATALIYGLSQTGGLFFAGTLADRSRWRWCFYVLSGLIVIPTLAIAMINILTSEPLPNHISGSDSSPSHDPSERRPRNRTPTSNSSASMGQPDGPLADLNLSSAGDGRRERRPRNRSPSVNYSFSMSQLDEPRSIQPDRLASDSQHEQSQDERSQHERIPRYGLSDWDEDETANSHPVRRPRSPFPKVVRYIGCAALYLTAGVLFLLAINWGIFGDRRHIEYRAVISISVFAILTIGLIVVLYLWGPDPKRHFRNASRSQARLLFLWESFVPGLSVGMSFRPLLYNLPIWLQALRASSATTASAYFMPTVVLYSAGFFIRPVYTLMRKTYFRRVRENHNSDTADTRRKLHFDFSQIFSLVSLVVMATGAGLLSTLQPTSYFDKIIGYQVLFGLGSGLIRSNSALFRASEYYGGAIAIGLGQLFFQNYHLNDTLAQVVLAKEDFNSNGHPKSIHPLLQIYNTALTRTFIISVVASALGAYASFWAFIKWGVSRDSFDPDTELVELPGPRRDVRSPSD